MNAIHACRLLVAATSLCALLPIARAQLTEAEKTALVEGLSKESSFAVPDSPASALLGDADIALSRPQSVQQLAMELTRLRDGSSEANGLSVAFAPLVLFNGKNITLQRYRDETSLRQLTRLELSVGLTNPPNDPGKVRRTALGLSLTPYDDGDPRLDQQLNTCITEVFKAVKEAPPPTTLGENPAFVNAFARAAPALKKCSDESAVRQRSANSLKLGVATGRATTGDAPGWQGGDSGLWLAGSYVPRFMRSPDDSAALRFLYRLQRVRLSEWDAATATWNRNRQTDAALQIRYAADSQGMDFIAEIGATRDKAADGTIRRISFGVEKRLMENLWFVLTATAKSGVDKDHPGTLVLGKLKYNFSADPILANR